jgi:hypothetical protein|tara:strand:- start:5411 stop:5566 length:156 start_codon:yes stop_codon:yes gene_type:complete
MGGSLQINENGLATQTWTDNLFSITKKVHGFLPLMEQKSDGEEANCFLDSL